MFLNCWNNVSEHAKIDKKHVLEWLKKVYEEVEKSWKKSFKKVK